MAVYRPKYRDQKTGKLKESATWWYHFSFAGRRIQESSKSARKTVAVEAEKNRRRDLEKSFNGIKDNRADRIRRVSDVADAYLAAYKLRHESYTFADYALKHVKKHLGSLITADIADHVVKDYQSARLKEKASPKSINEEVGFLLRILEDQGDAIRATMRRQKTLRLATGKSVARAFTEDEKTALLAEARKRRSPHIVPALTLALHCGLRDAELRDLTWSKVDLAKALLVVGDSKTEAGEGRPVPLNSDALAALVAHAKWYLDKFGETRPEWYLFPFGQPQPTNPAKPATSFKTVWTRIRKDAKITGRWHDNRHTFITDLAEQPDASDETIRQLAGHVSKQMLEHYSHIRMKAKRRAVDSLVKKPKTEPIPNEPAKVSAKVELPN
jgi:integrase